MLIGIILGRWAIIQKHWLGMGAALALVLIKPQVGALVALMWILTLPADLRWRALGAFASIWILSCLLTRVWWPLGSDPTSLPRSMSTRDAVRESGLPHGFYPIIVVVLLGLWGWKVYQQGPTDYVIALSLLVTGLSTPYIHRHSFTVPLATTFVLLKERSWPWALICYAPLLSLFIDHWQAWWEIGSWWLLLTGLIFTTPGQSQA